MRRIVPQILTETRLDNGVFRIIAIRVRESLHYTKIVSQSVSRSPLPLGTQSSVPRIKNAFKEDRNEMTLTKGLEFIAEGRVFELIHAVNVTERSIINDCVK